MSDLISTPSQTQSPVSNEAFEALIDLLASDGIDETPSRLAGNRPQAKMSLKDPSGKLDFDKIRMMFAAQNESQCGRVPPLEDGNSDDDDYHAHQSPSSMLPSRAHSSKQPVQRPSAGHRRSSTFGNQPWAAPIHENAANVQDVPEAQSRQPLSLDELNTALASAHEEVRSLRHQYDELRALVAKRLGTEARPFLNTDKENGRDEAPDGGAILPPGPPPSEVPTEVANLSENEAKRTLSVLARSLNLSLDTLASLSSTASMSPQSSLVPPNPARQHDVASIARALKFLGTVDELVWRRTSAPSGPRTLLPVFSEENVVALVARLELWERAVRRSSRI